MQNDTLTNKFHQNIIITPEHAGKRVDAVISELLNDFSRSQIQKWIKDGTVIVNGLPTKSKTILIGDENIQIEVEILPTNKWIAEDIDLNIIFEDDHIIVMNKPANMVVHPGAGNMTGTISNALLWHNNDQKNLPRAGIVHRLDKDTTGLMVAAKSSIAYHSLVKQLSERTVSRKYIAIVEGDIYEEGKINEPIGRDPSNRIKMAVNHKGKEAITNYTPYASYEGFTLIECRLETGRTHQIRVHMKSIKHPIIGDQTYNKSSNRLELVDIESFPRQALHAYSLSFNHPVSEEKVSYTIDLPKDMQDLCDKLEDRLDDGLDDIDFDDDYVNDFDAN